MADVAAVTPDKIAQAFIAACEAELRAPKPGNVHLFAAGHGMEAQDFIDSAHASAAPLTAPGASVGERILGAIDATWARVGRNTNLGIVLLCAPIAHAALTGDGADLRARIAVALAQLNRDDADSAFRAIRRARPAGLGAALRHDVAQPARTTLLEAMRAAAHRDRIAFQYAGGFEDVLGTGAAALARARAQGLDEQMSTLWLYVEFLCAFPDSHVVRKFGEDAGAQLMAEARAFASLLGAAPNRDSAFAAALTWDRSLKARRINPGTSADLTVAALFADYAASILANADKNG